MVRVKKFTISAKGDRLKTPYFRLVRDGTLFGSKYRSEANALAEMERLNAT